MHEVDHACDQVEKLTLIGKNAHITQLSYSTLISKSYQQGWECFNQIVLVKIYIIWVKKYRFESVSVDRSTKVFLYMKYKITTSYTKNI